MSKGVDFNPVILITIKPETRNNPHAVLSVRLQKTDFIGRDALKTLERFQAGIVPVDAPGCTHPQALLLIFTQAVNGITSQTQ